MNIFVLVKQVPDMDKVKFDREKGVIDRKSAGTEINPFDLNALEAAVQLGEKTGARVTAVSMGPPSAEQALRDCIARGAEKAVLVSDAKFGGSDTKATSVILAAALKKLAPYDLIIAGEKTVDGDTGQVGPQIAEHLHIPHVSYVSRIAGADDGKIEVCSEIWEGTYLKSVRLPALLTVTKDINEPRLPSFKSKMAARKAEIETLGFNDLTGYLAENEVGFKGSPTKVKKIQVPPASKREGKIYRETDIGRAEDEIVAALKTMKVLK